MKKQICFALQGGGAYGAYTWGILDKFLEDKRFEIDACSATSAGSVNAVLLAYGLLKNGRQGARNMLHDFWYAFGNYGAFISPMRQIYPDCIANMDISAQITFTLFDTFTRNLSPYLLNPFNLNILRNILLDTINFEELRKAKFPKIFLCATNVKTGKLKIFDHKELTVDAVLASACLPHLYQAVEVNHEFYWDGGFLGNPAIFPLIYNSLIDDIVIIHTNPITRTKVPISALEIANRSNEISFNSSLMRELRVIHFITELIDKKWIKEEHQDKLKRKFSHLIRSDEVMQKFNLINKYKWDWDYLNHLKELGRKTAADWIKNNYRHVGKKSTLNFDEFT